MPKKSDVVSVSVSELSGLERSMLEIMEILSIASVKELTIFVVKCDWHLDSSMHYIVVLSERFYSHKKI